MVAGGLATGCVAGPAAGIHPLLAVAGSVGVDGDQADIAFAQLGTRCSHVRCGPGVVFFRSDQSGVKAPVLEVFDYCSCDFTCVFVLPEEKENHFPMQKI